MAKVTLKAENKGCERMLRPGEASSEPAGVCDSDPPSTDNLFWTSWKGKYLVFFFCCCFLCFLAKRLKETDGSLIRGQRRGLYIPWCSDRHRCWTHFQARPSSSRLGLLSFRRTRENYETLIWIVDDVFNYFGAVYLTNAICIRERLFLSNYAKSIVPMVAPLKSFICSSAFMPAALFLQVRFLSLAATVNTPHDPCRWMKLQADADSALIIWDCLACNYLRIDFFTLKVFHNRLYPQIIITRQPVIVCVPRGTHTRGAQSRAAWN